MNNIDFFIIVPGYNASLWIEKCLQTIKEQTYINFKCLVVDDASTDNMYDKIIQYTKNDDRFIVQKNKTNQGALYNIVNGFKTLETENFPESVLMVIDADDWLASPRVLERIKKEYDDKQDLLFTYGNHIHYPTGDVSNCMDFPKEILDNNDFRKYKFISSHLRTFKSKLWHKIKDEDLREKDNGRYFLAAWDVSFCIPMLCMAGKDRISFIKDILYIYNRENPLSDDKIRGNEQGRIDDYIRTLPRYEVINFGNTINS